MAQPIRPTEIWHQFYDNPRDNTVLITKDNIKFRVSSRLLCKHSAIVNPSSSTIDVLDDQDQDVKPNITGLDMIRLDATCKTLDLFLSMLSPITRDLVLASLTFEQCRDLLTFTERYECEALVPCIRTYLIHTSVKPGRPTALFIFASDRNDWALGREAMKRMDASEMWPMLGITHSTSGKSAEDKTHAFLDRLRPEWKHTLIPLLFFGVLRTRGTQLTTMDWGICADQFVKPVSSPKRKMSEPATSSAAKKIRGG